MHYFSRWRNDGTRTYPKQKNMSDGMHQQLRHHLTLLLHHYRFPLLMQILSGDVERVLQLAHGGEKLTSYVEYPFVIYT